MNKISVAMLAVVVSISLMLSGCTPQQIAAVSQQAGVASIVTWISVDNPTDIQKKVASEIVSVVKSNAFLVSTGASYYATLTPVVNDYVMKHVQPQSQLIATLAGSWVLTGVDMFFAMYPQYAQNTQQALQVVNSFCDGASVGLAMSKDDPVIKAAIRGVTGLEKKDREYPRNLKRKVMRRVR